MSDRVQTSVWLTGQVCARDQRRGRYLPASAAHPARMQPSIARYLIATYSSPGELVFDPMAGAGTTLVEAIHCRRDGIGVEYEPRWVKLARANITHAKNQGATGFGQVVRGDARHLPGSLSADGEFICAAVSSGDRTIFCATTSRSGFVRLASVRQGRNGWTPQTTWESNREMFNFVRSLSVGDLDDDGDAEIVLGTKPNGVVLLLDPAAGGYRETILDQNSHGPGCTNTLEVLIADVDNDGSLEVVATNAYASESGKWAATAGSLTMYKRPGQAWQRRVIEDFAGKTHSRMFVVGDVLNTGKNQLVANVVGVFDPASRSIDPPSLITLYENVGGAVRSHVVDTLRRAVKARGMAVADIDGDGRRSLIVGTRSLDLDGYRRSYLLRYRFDAGSWSAEEIDRSGEMGFHTVAAMDTDNDGCEELIASDDERGLIKCYKRGPSGWRTTIIHNVGSRIFVASICAVSSRPLTSTYSNV